MPPNEETINLSLQAGLIYGIVGPDNLLISRWLDTLAIITQPAAGHVEFLNKATHNLNREHWQNLRTTLAYINHQTTLLSALNTQENILLPALYHRLLPRESLLENMYLLLNDIGFTGVENLTKLPAYLDQLAYFQAVLVRLVLTKPKLTIFDNCFRLFNQRLSNQLFNFVKSQTDFTTSSLVISDDNSDLVLAQAHHIIFIDETSLIEYDSVDKFHASTSPNVLNYINNLD